MMRTTSWPLDPTSSFSLTNIEVQKVVDDTAAIEDAHQLVSGRLQYGSCQTSMLLIILLAKPSAFKFFLFFLVQ